MNAAGGGRDGATFGPSLSYRKTQPLLLVGGIGYECRIICFKLAHAKFGARTVALSSRNKRISRY